VVDRVDEDQLRGRSKAPVERASAMKARKASSDGPSHRLSAGVDAHSVRRDNRCMGIDSETNVVSEIAQLEVSIDRAAVATETALADHQPARADNRQPSSLAEHRELSRQLAELGERVALAKRRNEGPRSLRAELATLLFFARTLQADADKWVSAVEEEAEELERITIAAGREQARLAAEREKLVRHRDALQSTILQTAARMAQQNRGECRRTVPVFTLGEGLTVCSVSVSCPRRWFRLGVQWLVTLNRSHEVLVRRE
jgi:hypothetical protein